MEDTENWFRNLLKQKESSELDWFLSRPSLRLARELGMPDMA